MRSSKDDDQPLLHARRPIGRPRKPGHVPGTSNAEGVDTSGPNGRALVCQASGPLLPRLLDLDATAAYLGVSGWTVRDLEAGGILHRVRVPLPNGGELRKVLFDRMELDTLVDQWKA